MDNKDENNKKKSEQKPASIKLTDEQNKELDFFITAPLRSADRLMKQLYDNDHFYETATHAWVGGNDAKKLFVYGVGKEVIKSCIGLINDKEFLQEVPDHKEKELDRMEKIIAGSITDTQTYRIRKMVELLSLLILFDRNTKSDEEYRIFLSAENLDLALSRQEDFRELYGGRTIFNMQHSVDGYAKRIQDDLKTLSVQELWFLHRDRLKNLRPSVFESKKKLFLAALLVASTDDNNTKNIITNFSYLSIICMHIMHLSYKIAGIDDPEGLTKVMGENFEKSEASKNIAEFKKELGVGDLVLTSWSDLAEIIEEHTSKYGYKAYKIKYLLRPPLPEFPEDWIESSNILARLMTKGWVRSFFEKNTSMDKMSQEVKEIWPEVMKQSDEELMKSLKHFFVNMHKNRILIPALVESGFLKKREESVW